MKTYCVLYNKKDKLLKKKVKKVSRQLKVRRKKLHEICYCSLEDNEVASYVQRIDETLFSNGFSPYFNNKGFILKADKHNQESLERILEQDFTKKEDFQKEVRKHSNHRTHKMAQKTLTTTHSTYTWTGIYAAGAALDIWTTVKAFRDFDSYVTEQNEAVNLLMPFFQAAGIDPLTSLTLACVTTMLPRLAVTPITRRAFRSNNLVTDGENTYFHKKPYDGALLKFILGYWAAEHIFAAGGNDRIYDILAQAKEQGRI